MITNFLCGGNGGSRSVGLALNVEFLNPLNCDPVGTGGCLAFGFRLE